MARRERSKQPEHLIGKPPVQLDKDVGIFVGISFTHLSRWECAYPRVNIEREIIRAAQWALNAGPKGIKKNYAIFLTKWFDRAQQTAELDQPEKDTGRSSRWM